MFFKTVSKDKPLFIGRGFRLDDVRKDKIIDIIQEQQNRKGHTLVFGTTRVGKTRLAENAIIQDIQAGRNLIIIDPKVDSELFSRVYKTALDCSRENDVMLISPLFPEHSARIGPLAHYAILEEPISHIMASVPVEDEFFYNTANEVVTVIVRGLYIIKKFKGQPVEFTFDEIALNVNFDNIQLIADELESLKGHDAIKIHSLAIGILSGEKEYYTKVSSTLRTALTQLTTGGISQVVGREKENEFIKRIESGKSVILYVQTGAMLQKHAAFTLGKVIISMTQALVGRYFASGLKFKIPLAIYIDEMSNCVYRGIEDMFNKAGGCDCYITALTQSPADVIAEIGPDRARKLFDNTNTKIFMRINDVDSASVLKTYGGKKLRQTVQLSLNGGMRGTEVEEDVLSETDFLTLQPREFFYFGFEGAFKGKTVPVSPCDVQIKLPNILNN